MDREIDWQMNRTDFIGSIPRRWRFNHVFLEFDNKFFLGYLAWLWAITEIINTRKRNTINIVQGSKSLKTMILSKFTSHNFHISWMFQIHSYIIDFQFFLLSWERTWYQRVQSWKFKTLLWIPNHGPLSRTLNNINFYLSTFPANINRKIFRKKKRKNPALGSFLTKGNCP